MLHNKRPKITVVGAGNVGAAVAHLTLLKSIGNVILIDIVEGKSQGKALDMQGIAPVEGLNGMVMGTNDFEDTAESDMIVITAGISRKSGMTRNDFLHTNMNVVRDVVKQVAPLSPNASIVLATNPSDIMAQVALQASGFAEEKIIGLGGVLDAARLRTFIAEEVGVSYKDVTAFVLGGHGDDMIPLVRYTYVGGIPVSSLLDGETIDNIVHRARFGGGEIANLLKSSSASFAPASSIVAMMEAILLDEKRILPVSAYLNGEYGMNGIFVGVPAILGAGGIEKVLEISLTDDEQDVLEKSAEGVQNVLSNI